MSSGWKKYTPGNGLAAPVFPATVTFIAGIPTSGKGNMYTPNSPKGVGYKATKVVRPGMETLTGGVGTKRGLKFG